jgi:O-antigen/teichoic acid export membrane protein
VPGWPYWKTSVREMLGFGAHLSIAGIFGPISSSMDRILIGRFWGASPVALYRQAYQLLVVPMDQLLGPMFQVTQPGLSMLQDDDSRYRRFYQKVLTVVCIATMPVSLFVAVNAAEITRVLLGRKWLDCAGILMILGLGTFIKEPVRWSAHILITRGKAGRYLKLTIFQNLGLVIFMLVGVRWGIKGVAFADVALIYLLAAPTLCFSFKGSPVTLRMFFSTVARPASAGIVMAIALSLLRQTLPPVGAPAFLILASFVAFAVFLGVWLLLPGGKAELFDLVSDLRSALRRKSTEVQPVEASNGGWFKSDVRACPRPNSLTMTP